ncbi:MAG TPA: radical SAM protein, partial [Enhygromyxa sp.]|nr:radical SAM protein [Enhygromyxa sp.]
MNGDKDGRASGFLHSRVVQVHPTLRCNLACSHCYSSSGPDATHELPPETLIAMLARLRAEGYGVVSFSGGEPLVYRGFSEVAHAARELGYRVNLISNGLLLSPGRIDQLAGVVSRVGVSIDGSEPVHDRIRGPGTFARTTRRLAHLRERGIVFGIAHCVTRESIADLPWLLEYCIEQGASLLQLHPLAAVGRAAGDDPRRLRAVDLARLYLIARLFEVEAGDALQIQLDLAPIEQVLASRDRYPVLAEPAGDRRPLAELVNPVVLDEHGRLWPLAHGMAGTQRIVDGPADDWGA